MTTHYFSRTKPLSVRTILAAMLLVAAAATPLVIFAESIAPSHGSVTAGSGSNDNDTGDDDGGWDYGSMGSGGGGGGG